MASGWMIRRRPLARFVTIGCVVDSGTDRRFTAFSAQGGSDTSVVFVGVKDSLPPNPFGDVGFPEGWGVRIALIACSRFRSCWATRFTSAADTFRMAAT